MSDWKKEQLWLTIIYRILECDEKIPVLTDGTDFAFIDKDLEELHGQDLIAIGEDQLHWVVTKKGEGIRNSMLAIYDQALKFEIFNTVHVALDLPEGTFEEDDKGFKHVLDHHYDLRFDPAVVREGEDIGTEDMRIAMMIFLSDCMANEEGAEDQPRLDPHRIVFMQLLAEGKLKDENIWFDLQLGMFFNEVEEIVESQYLWTNTGENEDDSRAVMEYLYTCGQLEQRKRDGYDCSECEIPLAVFEYSAKNPEEGDPEELTCCPNPDCGADFSPPVPDTPEYECPQCSDTVYQGQNKCHGCGALLDFSMPPGTVSEETEVVEETIAEDVYDPYDNYCVWGGYYDYTPYGYYDPYDPFVDALAFGVCCAILF